MGTKLGATFLRCAMGPLSYAGGCIQSGKVRDGLSELTADNLHGGYKRGVAEAAREVGVEAAEIERLLPMADVVVAAARVNAAQAAAAAAWASYADRGGGLMPGVGDLTVDGRAPDASAFLERLAKKVTRDPPLSEPLHDLAVAVGRWTDLVEQSSDLLAGGDVLAKAYRARRIRRTVPAVLGALVLVGVGATAIRARATRVRIDAGLSAEDPCAASLSPEDAPRATEAQRARAAELASACAARQRAEAEARETARAKEEKAKAAEAALHEAEGRCERLAEHLAAGSLAPEDGAVAEGKEALLVRIAHGALAPEDLVETSFPCAASPAAARVAAAYDAAVIRSPAAWSTAADLSERVVALLTAHKHEIAIAPKYALVTAADKAVKHAMFARAAPATEAATRLCTLKDALEVHGGRYCVALVALKASGKL